MSQTVTVTATDYHVKDISLAPLGRKRIEMAEKVRIQVMMNINMLNIYME